MFAYSRGAHEVNPECCLILHFKEWITLDKEGNNNTHVISFTLCRDPQFKEMLDLMAMLKKGYCDSVKVRIGRLQNLIASSCIGMKEIMKGAIFFF